MSDDNNEFWSNLFSHGSENSQQQQYDNEDSSQDDGQHGGEKLQPRSGGCWIVVLIAVLIVGALLYSGARIGGGRLKGVPGGGFDAGSRIYSLTQQTENYRTAHPDRRNYCLVALYLEDTSGNITDGPSQIVPGAGPVNNHCEQEALRIVKFGFFPKLQTANLRTIHIILFSQVRVCRGCKPTFDGWQGDLQTTLQQQAQKNAPNATPTPTPTVALYVYEIGYLTPAGFDPTLYPAGPSTQGPAQPGTKKPMPVQPQDINQVR